MLHPAPKRISKKTIGGLSGKVAIVTGASAGAGADRQGLSIALAEAGADIVGVDRAAKGINVDAIAPGYFATANTQQLRDDAAILERIPAGRRGKPADPGGAAGFFVRPLNHSSVIGTDHRALMPPPTIDEQASSIVGISAYPKSRRGLRIKIWSAQKR